MPTIKQELRAFSRVRLDRERADLDLDDLAYGLNVDLFLEPGTIRPRRGISKLYEASLGSHIRHLQRVDGYRYQVAGTVAYREQTSIVTGLDSTTLVTTIEAYRPLNDDTTWAFIADASGMHKASSSTVRDWGLTATASAPTLTAGETGGLTGVYKVETTELRLNGTAVVAESNPSSAGTSYTLASNVLAITRIPRPTDAQINGIGIYRTVSGGSSYLLDARLAIPTAATYSVTYDWEPGELSSQTTLLMHWPAIVTYGSDGYFASVTTAPSSTSNTEDAAGGRATQPWERDLYVTTQTHYYAYVSTVSDTGLGTELETDNDGPPSCGFVSAPFQERLWLTQNPDYPAYVYWSKRFEPEAFPTANYLDFGNPDDSIQGVWPFNSVAIVITERTKYRITGTSTGTYIAQECPSKRGTPSWMAVAPGEDGVYFCAKDGIFKTTGFSADEEISETIRPLFEGEAKNGLYAINWTYASLFSLEVYKGRIYFCYADTTSTTPNMLAVNRIGTNRWQFYQYPTSVGCASIHYEADTDKLLLGGQDGRVYEIETGATDDGASIAMVSEGKDLGQVTEESPTGTLARHIFHAHKQDLDPASGTVYADLYVDGTLVHTETLTGTRTPKPLRLPTTAQGYRWRMRHRYTGTGTAKVYGYSVEAIPMASGSGAQA